MKRLATDGAVIFSFLVGMLVISTIAYMGADNTRLEKENAILKVKLAFCQLPLDGHVSPLSSGR